jgi:surfeit locus 1 family protein
VSARDYTNGQARLQGLGRRVALPLAFGVLGTALLVLLGLWQVERLEWKLDTIARIEARLAAAPAAVPRSPDVAAHEYLRVRATGTLEAGELHVYTSLPPRGVGYRVIAPMTIEDGRRILIDRGFVPIGDKDAARATGPASVVGALVWPRETDRFTSDPDREANIWFARDVGRMAEALGTEPVMLTVEEGEGAAADGVIAMPVTVNLRNPHLEYAVTWFGLAAVWALMTLYWLWRIKRPAA